MKKSILLTFLLFPLLASCNNRDLGFPNPFPDDDYEPTGFKILPKGKITRPLTSEETALINATMQLQKDEDIYSNIKKEKIKIEERDYTRAFCGEFAQGYSVSNKMIRGEECIYRQDPPPDPSNNFTFKRRVDEIKTTNTYNYSYGDNIVNVNNTIYHYEASAKSLSNNEVTYKEELGGETYLSQDYDGVEFSNAKMATEEENQSWFLVSQSDFIFNPASATSLPGVNSDGHVVLIREEHKPYEGECAPDDQPGIYLFKDGRSYCARENTFRISILNREPEKKNEDVEWYFVNQARYYTETVITSEVIQPNVPITYLSKPVVINYREEKINFSLEDDEHTDQPHIDDVTFEDPEL